MELRGTTIAITGATGFLGRHVVEACLARGARVVGVVRNPDRVPELAARGVELRRADLADRGALAVAFAGADAIVSNAALLALGRDFAVLRDANVGGTENVFHAAADAGVARIVQVSSVAVYRDLLRRNAEDAPQLDETTRVWPWNSYAKSKALSEQRAWHLAGTLNLDLTVVRPSTIYGAFDGTFTAVFRRLAAFPITVMPSCLRLATVFAGDVADAIAVALERPATIGKAYNVTGDDRTVHALARAWRAAGGRTGVMLPLPVPLRMHYDSSRAAADLDFRNRPFAEAVADILARDP